MKAIDRQIWTELCNEERKQHHAWHRQRAAAIWWNALARGKIRSAWKAALAWCFWFFACFTMCTGATLPIWVEGPGDVWSYRFTGPGLSEPFVYLPHGLTEIELVTSGTVAVYGPGAWDLYLYGPNGAGADFWNYDTGTTYTAQGSAVDGQWGDNQNLLTLADLGFSTATGLATAAEIRALVPAPNPALVSVSPTAATSEVANAFNAASTTGLSVLAFLLILASVVAGLWLLRRRAATTR